MPTNSAPPHHQRTRAVIHWKKDTADTQGIKIGHASPVDYRLRSRWTKIYLAADGRRSPGTSESLLYT